MLGRLELVNKSGWIEFVLMSNLNGLKNSQYEINSFIKWIKKPSFLGGKVSTRTLGGPFRKGYT